MENLHGGNLNPHNINKLCCTNQRLQETQHLCHPEHCLILGGHEHQSTKIYHAFSNYVKTTFNNGLSLSTVDLSHLKRETIKHGPSLMEVNWGGNIDPNHTSSEVDWGAHTTHQNGHSITEVDWGAHDSSLFLYLVYIDHDAKPKDFFTQGLWGGLPQRTSSTSLMEYLRDSFATGQNEGGFSNSKSIKGYRSSYFLPDPEQHESSYNPLTQWDPGEKTLQLQLFRNESTSELTAKPKGSDRIFTIKLGLSQSLRVQEGAHNPNVPLKGYPKKFCGLFGQTAHKTEQITLKTPLITLFHPKKRFQP